MVLIVFGILAFLIILSILLAILRKMKGTIEIRLDKYQAAPGENISGNVLLKLKKDVESNELTVSLIGEVKKTKTSIGSNGKRDTSQATERIFEFNLPLDTKKTYNIGEKTYPFSIKVPKSIDNTSPALEGVGGTIVKTIMTLSGTNSQIRWFIQAHLDAKGLDLNSKQIQVNIS